MNKITKTTLLIAIGILVLFGCNNSKISNDQSHLEKLFIKGKESGYNIQTYLLDIELREAIIEKYGEKWFDMMNDTDWNDATCETIYNTEDSSYLCLNYDEIMAGVLRYYPRKNEVSLDFYFFDTPGKMDMNQATRVMPDGKAWCGNWTLDYFVNEFYEKDQRFPYVYISIPGVYSPKNWDVNIRIMYSDEGFRIVQEEDITWDTDIVIRRDSNGQTIKVPYREYGAGGIVTDEEYCDWITNVLNEGNFTIRVGSTVGRVTDETKGFNGAVMNMRYGGFFQFQ